jgi:endonuclease III
MQKKEKAKFIQEILNKLYPNPAIPLNHTNDFTFLIAVLLSARCTDARVNQITPKLFKLADTPQAMMNVKVEDIQDIIRPCGLSPKEAKAISKLSQILVEQHEGKVPDTFEELEALPGVGHKTASVVMAQTFHIPAFPVDTHIHRLAKRWGLSQGKNVKQTETDLKKTFPKKDWIKLHLQIIYFAREYCTARQHDVDKCPICSEITDRIT